MKEMQRLTVIIMLRGAAMPCFRTGWEVIQGVNSVD